MTKGKIITSFLYSNLLYVQSKHNVFWQYTANYHTAKHFPFGHGHGHGHGQVIRPPFNYSATATAKLLGNLLSIRPRLKYPLSIAAYCKFTVHFTTYLHTSVALIYQYQISIIDISMCFGIKISISISTSNWLKISNINIKLT